MNLRSLFETKHCENSWPTWTQLGAVQFGELAAAIKVPGSGPAQRVCVAQVSRAVMVIKSFLAELLLR